MNTPARAPNALDAWIARFINDPRDVPFVKLAAVTTLVVPTLAALLFVPGFLRWWTVIGYFVVAFQFLDRFILMLHNTSHRPLFRASHAWLNNWIPWLLGPFFGETPETYFAHHLGMHHPEANLPPDLSSTMKYQRDSLRDFLAYYARFMGTGLLDLAAYLKSKSRGKLRTRMLAGELTFWIVALGLTALNWRAAVVVFVAPVVLVRFLMMAGNWGQHAFVCDEQPGNPYRNSITVIRCSYNDRCFNDGYHIGHHVKATRHWTELPADFEDNRAEYVKQQAIVFERIDFFGVWALLMLGAYGRLAKHFVTLEGAPVRSQAEIIALLRSRTRIFQTEGSAAEPNRAAA
jgi:fatty acid desaturase